MRTWTDQGRLRCLRINSRGDRRYSAAELERFLDRAGDHQGGASLLLAAPTLAGPEPVAESSVASVLARVAELSGNSADTVALLESAAAALADAGYDGAAYLSESGPALSLSGGLDTDRRLARRALREKAPLVTRRARRAALVSLPLGSGGNAHGVLQLRRPEPGKLDAARETELLHALGAQLAAAIGSCRRLESAAGQRRRLEMLNAVSSDIGSQLDLARILNQLLDYATELFAADHAAVLRRLPTGSFVVDQSRSISAEFRQAIEHAPNLPLTQQAFEEGRIASASDYADDPRGSALRMAMVREGINTVTAAPLVSDGELLGALLLYHDTRYEWSAENTALLEQFAGMGAVALKNARNYGQMATWAAQLQSIQQLGVRLTRLNAVADIGQAICTELNQLIDCHNVRVYRIEDDDVVPVAWRGEVGEYTGEDGAQLRVKVGQGITGWVARYGVAQNLGDAAADRRTETIPGTEDDLDESLLLAPMLYEDEVIGVIVLAKLGLYQFTADDLRLLEIYASIAAQAMANADVTEKLRGQSEALARQLQSQRELLRVTESILSTLDGQELLDEIAVRLGTLLHVDNVAVHLYDEAEGIVRPVFARGVHAELYLAHAYGADVGLSAHVLRSGEAQLVQDALADERVAHFAEIGPQPGAVIIAPLRSRGRASGLITIQRLGKEAHFSEEEFELVKLFAGHASVALSNAETHRAVELRAETDPLTRLKNHGALLQHLADATEGGDPFSMLMIDLDGFKAFNDALGHEAGNVMLQRLAGVLRKSCREADQVFRYGGDEFAIILPGTSQAGALVVASKVRKAVRATRSPRGAGRISCSIGVATFPLDGTDRASILLAADRACYAAKRGGRDRVITGAEGVSISGETGRVASGAGPSGDVSSPADSYSAA